MKSMYNILSEAIFGRVCEARDYNRSKNVNPTKQIKLKYSKKKVDPDKWYMLDQRGTGVMFLDDHYGPWDDKKDGEAMISHIIKVSGNKYPHWIVQGKDIPKDLTKYTLKNQFKP